MHRREEGRIRTKGWEVKPREGDSLSLPSYLLQPAGSCKPLWISMDYPLQSPLASKQVSAQYISIFLLKKLGFKGKDALLVPCLQTQELHGLWSAPWKAACCGVESIGLAKLPLVASPINRSKATGDTTKSSTCACNLGTAIQRIRMDIIKNGTMFQQQSARLIPHWPGDSGAKSGRWCEPCAEMFVYLGPFLMYRQASVDALARLDAYQHVVMAHVSSMLHSSHPPLFRVHKVLAGIVMAGDHPPKAV